MDAVGQRLGGERAEHVLGRGPGEAEVVDGVAVVLGRPSSTAATVVTVPARPTNGAAASRMPGSCARDVLDVGVARR